MYSHHRTNLIFPLFLDKGPWKVDNVVTWLIQFTKCSRNGDKTSTERNPVSPISRTYQWFASFFGWALRAFWSKRGSSLFMILLSCGLSFSGALAERPVHGTLGSLDALLEPSLSFIYSLRRYRGMLDWMGSDILTTVYGRSFATLDFYVGGECRGSGQCCIAVNVRVGSDQPCMNEGLYGILQGKVLCMLVLSSERIKWCNRSTWRN